MMRKMLLISTFVLALMIGMFYGSHLTISSAQGTFSSVIPFSTQGGFGFFDRGDGKVYIYDGQMQRCTYIFQLEELGQAAKLEKSSGGSNLGEHVNTGTYGSW